MGVRGELRHYKRHSERLLVSVFCARMKMFASMTLRSAGRTFYVATELPKFADELVLVDVGECLGKPVGSSFELRGIGRVGAPLSGRGNVDAQGLTAASDRNGRIGFEKTGNAFAELTHADFNGGHTALLFPFVRIVYTRVYTQARLLSGSSGVR